MNQIHRFTFRQFPVLYITKCILEKKKPCSSDPTNDSSFGFHVAPQPGTCPSWEPRRSDFGVLATIATRKKRRASQEPVRIISVPCCGAPQPGTFLTGDPGSGRFLPGVPGSWRFLPGVSEGRFSDWDTFLDGVRHVTYKAALHRKYRYTWDRSDDTKKVS